MAQSKKLKVLWTLRSLDAGGCEMFTILLIPVLAQYFDISLLLTDSEGILFQQAIESGIKILKTDMRGKLNRKRIREGARFLAEYSPDIVHTQSFSNNFCVRIASILAKVPIIITHYHTMPAPRYTQELIKKEIRLLPTTDRSLFVTQASSNQFWDLIKSKVAEKERERLEVVKDAVDIVKLRNSASDEEVNAIRRLYILQDDARIIGTIARLHPVKNIEAFIYAASILYKKYPSLKCFVVGEGEKEYREKLQLLVNQLGLENVIIFTGFQENVGAYLRLFEVSVLTSHYEGLPRVIIESYAVGTPVVASYVPGMNEILNDGKEGFLADANNPQHLAERINWLLENNELRKKCGEQAKLTSEEFALKPYTEKICLLYDTSASAPYPSVQWEKKKYRMKYFLTRRI